MKLPKAFANLKELSTEIHHYSSILTLLHWDLETCMPPGGIIPRTKQIALLASFIHEKKTSRKFKENLEKLTSLSTGKIKVKGLSKTEQIILREWHRDFLRENKLPSAFVKNFSELTSEASQIWTLARKENNFKIFAPFLQKIIDQSRKKAEILGFEDHPYDALLESYEPCMTTKKVEVIFGKLQKKLRELLSKIADAKQIDDRFLQKKIDDKKQTELGKLIMAHLPYDMSYSRLDFSTHPFSTALHPHDSRITTRILPNSFISNIFSVLHEAGHSMYEMGLPIEHWGTPLCAATSLSIHESQSRWWETLVGRSLPFWQSFYPLLQKTLPHLKKIPLARFYKAINRVVPSCIRVEADEVTYGLHVIIRFEIEKALITGDLAVADLPAAWNEKMKEYLGVIPKNDAQGCLQDIHWSLGDFGYFPTYALGNLFSAQFFAAFTKEFPNWEEPVEKGDLTFMRQWLITNIHSLGRTYNAEELVKKVTGKHLSEAPYCSYLKKKYSEIYNLKSLHR